MLKRKVNGTWKEVITDNSLEQEALVGLQDFVLYLTELFRRIYREKSSDLVEVMSATNMELNQIIYEPQVLYNRADGRFYLEIDSELTPRTLTYNAQVQFMQWVHEYMQQEYPSDDLHNVNQHFANGVRQFNECARLPYVNPPLSKFGTLFDVFLPPEVIIQHRDVLSHCLEPVDTGIKKDL